MSIFFLLLSIVLLVNLMEDSQREHDEFMVEMDAFFDRLHAHLEASK